jgi:hypothetical protein
MQRSFVSYPKLSMFPLVCHRSLKLTSHVNALHSPTPQNLRAGIFSNVVLYYLTAKFSVSEKQLKQFCSLSDRIIFFFAVQSTLVVFDPLIRLAA